MSRDAKVGLVIVFAFVFLLGTILVHRLQFPTIGSGTADAAKESLREPVITEEAPGDPSSGPSSGGLPPTAVDAVSTDTLSLPPAGMGINSSLNSAHPPSQRLSGGPPSSRPLGGLPPGTDSGAHISLTDPQADRDRAAVVEPPPPTRDTGNTTSSGGQPPAVEPPENANDSIGHAAPLLSLRNPDPSGSEIPKREPQIRTSPAEVTPLTPSGREPEPPGESSNASPDEGRSMPESQISDSKSQISGGPSRNIPPLDTPPTINSQQKADEMESTSPPIQQAAGDRETDNEEPTPPRLPQYNDTTQPTIESVPPPRAQSGDSETKQPEDKASQTTDKNRAIPPQMESAKSRSVGTEAANSNASTGQKTYVVKEGDSFWTISAKQYGTARYFRALEEYNRERVSKSADGRKVLRPGTIVSLPDVSVLRGKPSSTKPADPAPAKDSRSSQWNEEPAASKPAGSHRHAEARQETPPRPGTYRVKEGDTLSTIALRELGSAKRWQEIFQLNREKLPDERSVRVGMELKMPPARPAEKTAERPYTGR